MALTNTIGENIKNESEKIRTLILAYNWVREPSSHVIEENGGKNPSAAGFKKKTKKKSL